MRVPEPLIEQWANKRAAEVLPADDASSFVNLPLRAKLIALALFARIGGDTAMWEKAMEGLGYLQD